MCNLWFKALQHLSILGVYHWRCSDSLLVPRSPFLARYLGLIKKLYSYIFLPSQVIRISLQGVLVVQPDKRGCSCDRQPKSHWKVFTAGQERDSKLPGTPQRIAALAFRRVMLQMCQYVELSLAQALVQGSGACSPLRCGVSNNLHRTNICIAKMLSGC